MWYCSVGYFLYWNEVKKKKEEIFIRKKKYNIAVARDCCVCCNFDILGRWKEKVKRSKDQTDLWFVMLCIIYVYTSPVKHTYILYNSFIKSWEFSIKQSEIGIYVQFMVFFFARQRIIVGWFISYYYTSMVEWIFKTKEFIRLKEVMPGYLQKKVCVCCDHKNSVTY